MKFQGEITGVKMRYKRIDDRNTYPIQLKMVTSKDSKVSLQAAREILGQTVDVAVKRLPKKEYFYGNKEEKKKWDEKQKKKAEAALKRQPLRFRALMGQAELLTPIGYGNDDRPRLGFPMEVDTGTEIDLNRLQKCYRKDLAIEIEPAQVSMDLGPKRKKGKKK